MKNAESAGFVNAIPDPDGCIRKVNPFLKHDGKYYGQLVFPSLLKKLDAGGIEVDDFYIARNSSFLN